MNIIIKTGLAYLFLISILTVVSLHILACSIFRELGYGINISFAFRSFYICTI